MAGQITGEKVIELFTKSKIDIVEIADPYWSERYQSVTNPTETIKPQNLENAKLMSLIAKYNEEIDDAHVRLMANIKSSFSSEEIVKIWDNMSDAIKDDLLAMK